MIGILGFFLLLGIAFALSSDRKAIRWQTVAWGIGLQISLAWMVLRGDLLSHGFDWLPFSFRTVVLGILVQLGLLRILRHLSGQTPILSRYLSIFIFVQVLICVLKFNLVATLFLSMRAAVDGLIAYSSEGARFVFGPLGLEKGEKSVG